MAVYRLLQLISRGGRVDADTSNRGTRSFLQSLNSGTAITKELTVARRSYAFQLPRAPLLSHRGPCKILQVPQHKRRVLHWTILHRSVARSR